MMLINLYEQRLSQEDVEDNIIVSEKKNYEFTNAVDQFILGFYEISDLHIIASIQSSKPTRYMQSKSGIV